MRSIPCHRVPCEVLRPLLELAAILTIQANDIDMHELQSLSSLATSGSSPLRRAPGGEERSRVAKLLNGLQLVHVNVIGLIVRIGRAREAGATHSQELDGKGWEPSSPPKKHEQDVSVYLKMGDKDAVQGLAVVVMDGKERPSSSHRCDIRPEQLGLLGENHIDPLKKSDAKQKVNWKSESPA